MNSSHFISFLNLTLKLTVIQSKYVQQVVKGLAQKHLKKVC